MIRIKMPLNFRMQNFLFLPNGGIFWTSASKTLWQKFIGLLIIIGLFKDEGDFCNTSKGYKLPFHGQRIALEEGRFLINDNGIIEKSFYIDNGKFLGSNDSRLPGANKLPKGKKDQGMAFNPLSNSYTLALIGNRGKDNIEIYDLSDQSLTNIFIYDDYKEWYWESWEAEGIQYDSNGDLWFGFSVKTKFGIILNYIEKV